ncbi:XRE family transcriptional regulator [Rurimicrobium arvi]
MSQQKIFWAENVKFLRQRKKMSQEAMAETLGISRSKLNAHENGHTVNPPVEDLIRISEFFKISIDSLLKIEMAKLGELKLRELEAGNDVYTAGKNIRVLAITVNKDNKENIEYVPVKARAGYRSSYNDPEFIADLPKYSFPGLSPNATYRMFPTVGDSMLPIPAGSDLITSYVQDWSGIRAGTLCVVILNGEQDFVFKKVSFQKDGTLLLESLNEAYAPYTVQVSDVLEIWQFERFISKDIPDRATDLDELKMMIADIKKTLGK